MQNNPNGPYDDVFSNLAKIVEDIVQEYARKASMPVLSGIRSSPGSLRLMTPGSFISIRRKTMMTYPTK